MSVSEEDDNHERFFSVKQDEDKRDSHHSVSLERSNESMNRPNCCLRGIQCLMPCIKQKGVWEASKGNVFKGHDVEEAKYPRVLKILESQFLDYIFLCASILSIFLVLFAEGFFHEIPFWWGVIHLVNCVYVLGQFCQWLQILMKAKYSTSSHGYTTRDIVYTLISVFPSDVIVIGIYTIYAFNDTRHNPNHPKVPHWAITISRVNYLLRIRDVQRYFAKFEDHLAIGDLKMFLMRTMFFATLLIHMFACMWHRVACDSLRDDFESVSLEEASKVCDNGTWFSLLLQTKKVPLLDHPNWSNLAVHYLVSLYWTIVVTFRLGAGDVRTSLTDDMEVAFVSFTEIVAWIFVLTHVNGTLTSLLIEKDTEKENFLTRCFAIRHYLNFGEILRPIQDDVNRFYNYLWERSSGLINLDLVDVMPYAMKTAVFYDVNKFVLDQLPLLKGLDTPFLMSISVRTNHRFYMSGEILFKRNETAFAMYYLVKGHLEVMSEDERHVITTIRSGSALGEIHLLQPYPHIATVRCGSDCEIRTLSRKHFKQVLSIYPQYESILGQRLETRLEQCGLLLALCEKHNTYHKAFKALQEFKDHGSIEFRHSDQSHSFENVTKILSSTGPAENINRSDRYSYDFDGLSLSGEFEARNMSSAIDGDLTKKGYEEMLVAAFEALETDVARAGALAKDLNIPRPPLVVTAPGTSTHVTLGFKQQAAEENICVSCIKRLKQPQRGDYVLCWKFIVTICALLVSWYYPYQFGFMNDTLLYCDYIAHIFDLIFALDCFYDMIQIVVTPQKTFESAKEITLYRLKSPYFYLRVAAFVPFEYIVAHILGTGTSPYYYLFKMNRLIEIHVVFRFLFEVETRFRIKPIVVIMGKFALGLFTVTHVFAVWHAFVLPENAEVRRLYNKMEIYRHCFYWSLVVVTSLGYGDWPSHSSQQLIVEILGLMIGVTTIIYMTAKVASMLVNTERRRKFFKQTFYSLDAFMKRRKFPKSLAARISNYYSLQWRAHQGTLIPRGKSIMWDAPKAIVTRVCHALAYKFVARIPLFTHAPIYLQNEICVALKGYLVPPGEVLLHPNELANDLYIISRGYVEVSQGGKRMAVFTEGRYFGLNGLLYGVNTHFKFTTITHCYLYCLNRDSFVKVMNSNPNFVREVDLLIGVEKLTPYQALNPSSHVSCLPSYPSKEFLDRLQEDLARFGTDLIKQDTSAVASYFRSLSACCTKNSLTNCYILPNGSFIKWWMAIRLTFALFAAIFAAAQLAFPISSRVSFVGMLCFDVIAWTDILICFRVAFYGDSTQLVTKSSRMAIHYLKGAFLLDLIACFPADIIAYVYIGEYDADVDHYFDTHYIVALLRLNRMLQCYKIFVTNGFLEKAMFKSLSVLMLAEIGPVMFLLINIMACMGVLIVCGFFPYDFHTHCSPNSWIILGMEHLNYKNVSESVEDTSSILRAYYIGLYWVTQSILSVGYGDVSAGTDTVNQFVAIVVIFLGVLSVAYAGGKLTSCIVGEDPGKTELQGKMNLMNTFLEQQRVSGSVRRRVRETYLNAWDKTLGVSPTTLFQALPPTLKTDVMRQLYASTLKSSPLFENLDDPGIRLLSNSLQEIFYPEGDFLMKFGDLCNDIFFIAHGAVVCYNVRGVIMSQMGRGSIIGEIASFFHTHRLYTAIAVKDVNAYIFKKEAFMAFLSQYPQIKILLESYSLKHYREAMMGKRTENLAGPIRLTLENETRPSTMSHSLRPPSITGVPNESIYKSVDLTPSKGANSSSQGQGPLFFNNSIFENDTDLTRNVLKENVLKSPEDLSKVAADKWWSTFITFGRMARDEMGLIHIYQESGQCNVLNFTVHPASSICNWVSLYLVLTAFSCSITAYEISFARGMARNEDSETIVLIHIRNVLEIFFILRIIGNFHLGYYDETATLITDVKSISHRYIYRIDGLWVDLLSIFPFYLILDILRADWADYIRALQLLRVHLFVRYLQQSDSNLKMKAFRAKILKITVLLCFIFHFWACAWYLAACYDTPCTTGSWMDKLLPFLEERTDEKGVKIAVTVTTKYILSLYYVSNALTATGFSDITARSNIELCLAITMMFGTVFVIGYLVGEMAQCLASQVATKIHYQHKLTVLENHFTSLGISHERILAIREYFKLLWCRCKGATVHELMEELPYSLRADVAMEIYGTNLKNSRILGKLDENLIRQICARIRHEIYFPGSHIIRAGDVCSSMYFIKTGEVVILDGNSNLELCIEILYENECFGEVKILLSKEQYRFSYVARLETEVGVLLKEDLEAVLQNHPRIYENVKEKANKIKLKRYSNIEDENKPGSISRGRSVMSIKSSRSRNSTGKRPF